MPGRSQIIETGYYIVAVSHSGVTVHNGLGNGCLGFSDASPSKSASSWLGKGLVIENLTLVEVAGTAAWI